MIVHVLSSDELEAAQRVGRARDASSVKRRSRNAHGLQATAEQSVQIHIDGAAAELAAALALGVKWPASVDTFKTTPDLPPKWEVRRRSRWDYDCLVRTDDVDIRRAVHVVGAGSQFAVVGWIGIGDAKIDRFIRSYGGREKAWFVPLSELHPVGKSLRYPDARWKGNSEIECSCGSRKADLISMPQSGFVMETCAKCDKFFGWSRS